jgi:hypothetical protein
MKTRSHKKYRKRVGRKSRRNKVGGNPILSFFGFGSAPVVPTNVTPTTDLDSAVNPVTKQKPCPQGPSGETEADRQKRCNAFNSYTSLSQQQQTSIPSTYRNPLSDYNTETSSSASLDSRPSSPGLRIGGKRTRKNKKSKRSRK